MSLFVFLFIVTATAGFKYLPEKDADDQMVSCVIKIVNRYTDRRTVVFYNEEEQNSDLWVKTIRNMNKPFMIVSQQQQFLETDLLMLILFPEQNTSYSSLLEKVRKNSLFIIIANKYFTKEYIGKILKRFHDFKMIYDILLLPLQNAINVYTSFPYSKKHCAENGPPMLIDSFEKEKFLNKTSLFNTGKYWNMYGCTLTCLMNGQAPDVNLSVKSNGEIQLERVAKELMTILSERLNFKVNTILPNALDQSWFFYNNTVDQIKDYIRNEQTDFAMGVFSRLAFMDNTIMFGKETRFECYTWAVPVRAGKKRTVIMNYVEEFTVNFWILFMASVVAGVFVIVAVTRITGEDVFLQSFLNAFLYLFATVVNQPFPVKPKPSSLRLFLVHWLSYVVVVTTAYQAALWSFMTIPWQVHNINSLQDLLNSNLEVGGAQQMLNVIISMQRNNDNIKQLIERFKVLPPTDFRDIMHRIETKRDFAVFGEKSHLSSYLKSNNNTLQNDRIHIVNDCQYESMMTLLLFPSGSPLYTPMNTMLLRMLQNGIIRHLLSESVELNDKSTSQTSTINQQTTSYKPMTFSQCRGIFIILIFGYGIAFVVLLCEIVFFNVSNSQQTVNVIVGPKLFQRTI